MEDVNKRLQIFLSLSKLEWGLQEFNSMEICLHLTFSANYKSLKKREFILKVTFLVPSAPSMLKLPRLSVKWWWMKLKLSIVAETVYCIVLFQFLWCQRKFDGGGLKVWFLVDLVVDYMVSDGEMVEWQGEIQVMSGMVIWRESDRYLWWVWGVEVRNNVR